MKTKLYLLIPLIIIIFLSFSFQTQAQSRHADNVIFGKWHISFQTGYPQMINQNVFGQIQSEDTKFAVYSENNGNLILYSDGASLWNHNYQFIDSLSADSGRSNIVIPMPDNPDLIYLFSLTSHNNFSINSDMDTLFYSLIDISDSIPQVIIKNQVFTSHYLTQDLTAVKHANGHDYWLVSRKHMKNEFVAFHLQPSNNVDTVVSVAGIKPETSQGYVDNMKFSPNGRFLADGTTKSDTIQILHFNASTGIVADTAKRFIHDYVNYYWPSWFEFSSNSQFIYARHSTGSATGVINQYDLNYNSQTYFEASRWPVHNFDHQHTAYDMFLAADQKIYNHAVINDSSGLAQYFNSINQPNLPDSNCNYQPQNFLLEHYTNDYYKALPKFVSSWLQEPVDISYTNTCTGENVKPTHFALTDSVYEVTWHFSDSATSGPDTSSLFYPSHKYLQPGQYTVWAKALHYGMWDSVAQTITIHQSPQISLGSDTTLTGNDTLVLDPGGGYVNYKWNNGDTTQTLTLYGSQMTGGSHSYWVEVTDSNGCEGKAYRTVTYSGVGINEQNADKWKVYPNPAEERLTVELDQALHEEATLRLYNQHGAIVRRHQWPKQAKTQHLSLSALSDGIYWLELDGEQRKYRQKVMKR
ncbi:MAG: T9SS type A sorting domain-containing protein [Bacteroidota bacterium]